MTPLNESELKMIFQLIPLYSRTFFRGPLAMLADHDGISRQHIHAVVYLRMNGPSPMSTVARFLDLEKGSFTPIANRLTQWGYVERQSDDSDRRKSLLQLTASGREFASRLHQERSRKFSSQLEKLNNQQRRQFFQALDRLEDLLRLMNTPSEDLQEADQ
jgi:DNA-binding MarR family transcriptional regulator